MRDKKYKKRKTMLVCGGVLWIIISAILIFSLFEKKSILNLTQGGPGTYMYQSEGKILQFLPDERLLVELLPGQDTLSFFESAKIYIDYSKAYIYDTDFTKMTRADVTAAFRVGDLVRFHYFSYDISQNEVVVRSCGKQ